MIKKLSDVCRDHFIVLAVFFYMLGLAKHFDLDWKLTEYHINYLQFGFVKRGVVGTLLFPILSLLRDGGMAERSLIIIFDFVIFLVLVSLLKRALDDFPEEWTEIRDFLRPILIFSPVGFIEMGFDVGRFDHLNFLLLAAIVLLCRRKAFMAASVVLAIGIFIHEAVFFYGLPVMIVAATLDGYDLRRISSAVAIPLVSIAIIAAFGNLNKEMISTLPNAISAGSHAYSRGIFEPAGYLGMTNYVVLLFYIALPYAFVMQFTRNLGVPSHRVSLPLLFVLPLFVLGKDYFRWVHLVFVSTLSVVFLLGFSLPLKQIKLSTLQKRLALAYSFPLGPIGIDFALPYVHSVVSRLCHFA